MSTSSPDAAANLVWLRDFLAARDEACPSCAYNLRGLTSDRCPECDETLVLRVNIAEHKLGVWIATLAGMLATGGAALVCLMIVVDMSLVNRGWPRGKEFFPIVIYPMLIVAAYGVMILWLASPRGRRWFRGKSLLARRAMAVGAWGLLVVLLGAFLQMVH